MGPPNYELMRPLEFSLHFTKGVIGMLVDYRDDIEQVKKITREGWDRL
jgi:hypothetical protein